MRHYLPSKCESSTPIVDTILFWAEIFYEISVAHWISIPTRYRATKSRFQCNHFPKHLRNIHRNKLHKNCSTTTKKVAFCLMTITLRSPTIKNAFLQRLRQPFFHPNTTDNQCKKLRRNAHISHHNNASNWANYFPNFHDFLMAPFVLIHIRR